MAKAKDITGMKFGRLTALKLNRIEYKKDGGTHHYWLCKCECGKEIEVCKNSLLTGHTKSCGCYKKEIVRKINIKHGLRNNKLYKKWLSIKSRCLNPKNQNYKYYGARGIIICKEWKNNFEDFYNWAINSGYKEKSNKYECTIDRIDVNGNYEPNNCRWVSQKVQNRNTRKNINITYNNKILCLKDWCELLNLDYDKTRKRIRYCNWTVEKAFNTP